MNPPEPLATDTRHLRLHGHRIAVRIQGAGDPLLLINGMTRPLQSWEPFSWHLPGRTVISFDAPGVGDSATPLLPLSMPGLGAVAAAALDAAGVDRADVVGYSHGGAVAQQLAADSPGRVARLILVSTSCGLGAVPGAQYALLRGLGAPATDPGWPLPDPLGMFWHSLAFWNWSSVPFLARLRVATLVVSGTHDRVVPPVNSQILAGRIPGASLALVPGGHDLQRPDPARALARVVEEFLQTPVPAAQPAHLNR